MSGSGYCTASGFDQSRTVGVDKAGSVFCAEAEVMAAPASDAVRKVRRFQARGLLVSFAISVKVYRKSTIKRKPGFSGFRPKRYVSARPAA
jgi:hypothetical protein